MLRRCLIEFLLLESYLRLQTLDLGSKLACISLKINDFLIFLGKIEFAILKILLDNIGLVFGWIEELLEILALST